MIEFRVSPDYILGQNFTVKIYDKLTKVKKSQKKTKLISVPIILHWNHQTFYGIYHAKIMEPNIVIDYYFQWETIENEKCIDNSCFHPQVSEKVSKKIIDIINTQQTNK
jgi:hypothetical protein